MNPKFGEVDLVPDDELNTKLKFYVSMHNMPQVITCHRWELYLSKCESIVEDLEEDLTELLADEENDRDLKKEICSRRSDICAAKKKKKRKKSEEL